jgi:hypothetical protein
MRTPPSSGPCTPKPISLVKLSSSIRESIVSENCVRAFFSRRINSAQEQGAKFPLLVLKVYEPGLNP